MQIVTHTGGAYTKPIDAQTRLAHAPDGQEQGDALDKRQQYQGPEQVLHALGRLAERQQHTATAVKAFARIGTPQQLQDVADSAVAVGQQAHLLEAGLREFALLGLVDTRDVRMFEGQTLAQLRTLETPAPLTHEVLNQPNSSSDFFEQLLAMIGQIRGEYLAVYEELLKTYSDFYSEFNTEVMAKMGQWIKGDGDGKQVEINFDFYITIRNLIDKHSQTVLFPLPNAPSATEAEVRKWAKAMGMGENSPNIREEPAGSGQFVLLMDVSPLNRMAEQLDALPFVGGVIKVDSAKFQAWQTGFNSLEGELKNQLQVFTTKYGNANSYHENFNKILSSQLSQYAEMLKAIASGIA